MTEGFDLDEIERELMLDDLSWWRMNRVTKAGHAAITAMLTEIRELRAENARLRGRNRQLKSRQRSAFDAGYDAGQESARPDGPIGFENTREAEWANFTRAALGEPQ